MTINSPGETTSATSFGPLVAPVEKRVRELVIFERNAARSDRVLPAEAAYEELPRCDVAIITSTALILGGMDRGYLEGADFMRYLEWFGICWAGFTVIAFIIYGVLAGQRAIKSFRSNIRKL